MTPHQIAAGTYFVRGKQLLSEVVVFFDGFLDVPGALEVLGENDQIARAETHRILAVFVRNGYFAFEQKAGFLLCILPVEGAGLAFPDWPGLAGFDFLVRGFFHNHIFNGRHSVFPFFFCAWRFAIRAAIRSCDYTSRGAVLKYSMGIFLKSCYKLTAKRFWLEVRALWSRSR